MYIRTCVLLLDSSSFDDPLPERGLSDKGGGMPGLVVLAPVGTGTCGTGYAGTWHPLGGTTIPRICTRSPSPNYQIYHLKHRQPERLEDWKELGELRETGGKLEGDGREVGGRREGSWRETGGKLEGDGREVGGRREGSWRETGGKLEGDGREVGGRREGSWRETGGKLEGDGREVGGRREGSWRETGGKLEGDGREVGGRREGSWRETGGKLEGDGRQVGGRWEASRRELGRTWEGSLEVSLKKIGGKLGWKELMCGGVLTINEVLSEGVVTEHLHQHPHCSYHCLRVNSRIHEQKQPIKSQRVVQLTCKPTQYVHIHKN